MFTRKPINTQSNLRKITDTPLPIGDIQFYDNYLPVLKDDNYRITVTPVLPDVLNDDPSFSQDTQPFSQFFAVQGPRFQLPSTDIYAMSPAVQSTGQYDTYLPHIVFTKRALPWERYLSDNKTPWLALLVFTEDELQLPATLPVTTGAYTDTVDTFLQEETDTLKPILTEVSTDEKAMTCNFIKLSSPLFTQFIPLLTELPFWAHCRQVNTGDKEILGLKDDGFFSVVVANRFPKVSTGNDTAPIKNIVHLVSLEGCETYIQNPASLNKNFIQLISLASWTFTCLTDPKENFATLLNQMLQDPKAGDNLPLLRVMPLPQALAETDPAIATRLANGYVPMLYHTRTGENTMAWYRGGWAPGEIAVLDMLPMSSQTGANYMIYDPTTGIFDVSYAAAWQLGRSLAVADSHFAQSLVQYRLQVQQQIGKLIQRQLKNPNLKNDELFPFVKEPTSKQKLVEHLRDGWLQSIQKTLTAPGNKSTEKATFKPRQLPIKTTPEEKALHSRAMLAAQIKAGLDVPLVIQQWLIQLRQFIGLPFYYLVPDEKLLPKESLRFFHVDSNWLDTLTRGALTIGIHTSQDETLSEAIFKQLQAGFSQTDPISGLLIRSSVVSGWPGLAIRLNADMQNIATPVKVIRQERLASDLLLCLFDGVPQQVAICEPQEQLSFGVSGDDLFQDGFIELRSLQKDTVGFPFSPDPSLNKLPVATLFRSGGNRVFNISALTDALNQRKVPPSSGSEFSPADIAIELVRAPEEVNFNPAPKFMYDLTTTPSPIEVGQKADFNLNITADTSSSSVYVKEIAVQFPIGTDQYALTSDSANLQIQISPADTWQVISSADVAGLLLITPKSGKLEPIPSQGLALQCAVSIVNNIVGTCDIGIQETISNDQVGNNLSIGNRDFWISKCSTPTEKIAPRLNLNLTIFGRKRPIIPLKAGDEANAAVQRSNI